MCDCCADSFAELSVQGRPGGPAAPRLAAPVRRARAADPDLGRAGARRHGGPARALHLLGRVQRLAPDDPLLLAGARALPGARTARASQVRYRLLPSAPPRLQGALPAF